MNQPDPSARVRRLGGPQLLLLGCMAIWGASFVATKDALGHLQPFGLIALRFWLAIVLMLPLLPWRNGDAWRRSLRPGLLIGLFLAIGYALQTIGMTETSASMGGFLVGLIVLLVALGSFLFLGVRLTQATVIGMGLGLVGLVLLCLPQGGDAPGQRDTAFGIAMQLGSSTAFAGHILLISKISPRGAEVPFTFLQLVVTAVVATVAVPLQGQGLWLPGGDPGALRVWVDLAYLAAFATVLGIVVQSRVQPRIPGNQVALLFAAQPGFAAAAGWLLRGEQLGLLQWAGGVLVMLGIVAASRR